MLILQIYDSEWINNYFLLSKHSYHEHYFLHHTKILVPISNQEFLDCCDFLTPCRSTHLESCKLVMLFMCRDQ